MNFREVTLFKKPTDEGDQSHLLTNPGVEPAQAAEAMTDLAKIGLISPPELKSEFHQAPTSDTIEFPGGILVPRDEPGAVKAVSIGKSAVKGITLDKDGNDIGVFTSEIKN